MRCENFAFELTVRPKVLKIQAYCPLHLLPSHESNYMYTSHLVSSD